MDRQISDDSVKHVAVVGAGYIGVEIAEGSETPRKGSALFDVAPTSLASYYDPEFAKDMDKNLQEHGIETHYGERAVAYKGTGHVEAIVTDKGEYPAELVINAIGFRRTTSLERTIWNALQTARTVWDRHQQTSDPDVYAVGDCATIYSNALQAETYIALATNAGSFGNRGGA